MFFPRGCCLGKYTELWVSGLLFAWSDCIFWGRIWICDLTDTDGEYRDQCRLDVWSRALKAGARGNPEGRGGEGGGGGSERGMRVHLADSKCQGMGKHHCSIGKELFSNYSKLIKKKLKKNYSLLGKDKLALSLLGPRDWYFLDFIEVRRWIFPRGIPLEEVSTVYSSFFCHVHCLLVWWNKGEVGAVFWSRNLGSEGGALHS